MGIQNWSENIILVNLAKEPEMGDELHIVITMVTDNPVYDVVIDFADVDIVTSSSIAKILRLQKALNDNNSRLVLCSIGAKTRSIFEITGLGSVFEFVDDQFVALAGLQMAN